MREPDYSPQVKEVISRLTSKNEREEEARQLEIKRLDKTSDEFMGLGGILVLSAMLVGALTSGTLGWITFAIGISMIGYGLFLSSKKHQLMYKKSTVENGG